MQVQMYELGHVFRVPDHALTYVERLGWNNGWNWYPLF
jgi:hypothetical protein